MDQNRDALPADPTASARGLRRIWMAAFVALLTWLVAAWLSSPVPPRPDVRPIGDIAFLLGLVVLPVALLLGLIGGALARPMPRLAPIVTAVLVTAVVAVGASESGFSSFHVLCGAEGYPSCTTDVRSRVLAIGGAIFVWGLAAVMSIAAARSRPSRARRDSGVAQTLVGA